MTDKEYPCDGCAYDHNCENRKKVDCCDFCKWCYNGDSPCNFCKKNMMTNEEWFCNLSTEEKAKRIINIAVNSDCDYRTIVEWLKQNHTKKETE